ncbi:MAG: phosphate signaling complex protein PhoU [Clostridium sp.]|nr:phosphate signaling complex protein PhoU [Clostridium sp.]
MPRKIFDSDLEALNMSLLRMGSITEKQIFEAVEALCNKDEKEAKQVVKNDSIVDEMQKDIENEVIRLIAMQQPIATDLRTIFTTLKIVTDLERMADHAVDIAKVVKRLKIQKPIKSFDDIPRMTIIVREMIKESIDAYVTKDMDKAYEICKKDDEIDGIYKQVFNDLLLIMMKDQSTINEASQYLFVCKYLERIVDHTTNICESTIYLVTGKQIDLNE